MRNAVAKRRKRILKIYRIFFDFIYLELRCFDRPIITANIMPGYSLYIHPEQGRLQQPTVPPTQASFCLTVSTTVVVAGLSDA